MPAPKGLHDYIFNYKTKNDKGFTKGEINDVLRKYGIQQDDFSEKLGVVTCLMVDGEFIFYHSDVYTAIRCCIENRNPTLYEID